MPDGFDTQTGEVIAPLSQSQQIDKLAAALAKAQGQIENPRRDRVVKVATKTGGSYKFRYATLSAVTDAIRRPLADNGLAYSHTLTERGNRYRLVTRLMHSSGQWIESETPLFISEQSNQAFGSAISYGKRYSICALLGVAADEDDDGNAADGNSAEKQDEPQRRNGNGHTRTAVPETPADSPQWKLMAVKLKKLIDTAPGVDELDLRVRNCGHDFEAGEPTAGSYLAEVKAHSVRSYDALLEAYGAKRADLMTAAMQ